MTTIKTDDLNDSLDNLFAGDTGEVRTVPAAPRAAETYAVAQATYFQPCTKCRGTGQTPWGTCFRCRGTKGKTFKTSPESRAKASDQRQARQNRIEQEGIEAFKSEHRAAYEWLVATAPRWDLAASLLAGLHRYGSLTEKQMAIVTNGIARDTARALQRAEKAADAPAVDTAGVDRLKASFDQAKRYAAEKGLSLRTPKITIGGVTISPAKADSRNAGALYVKDGGVYVGKIAGGRFYAANANGDDVAAKVQAFIADPAEAAKVYGQTTGTCCLCGAMLKSKWKHLGVGPVCSAKWGFS